MKRRKSPILGVGNDIIETDRIRKAIESHGYRILSRLFTTKEQDYCLKHKDPIPHFAGRFCAKEAIVKALGFGFGKYASWLDIEILNDTHGKPVVHFSPLVNKRFKKPHVSISISHCKAYVTAVAVWMA